MAITATGENSALTSSTTTGTAENPNGILGKDDFLKLLLVQLQYQDPTEPTDSEKILTQTSQLASLESAQNTNDALEKLSSSLQSSQEFSIVSSIGKRADLGSDAIAQEEGSPTTFEVYFPENIKSGTVDITDLEGNSVATIPIDIPEGQESLNAGVYQFTWDGFNNNGESAESGIYRVNSAYTDPDGTAQSTRLGAYPIESVRFEEGKAFLKLGSNYVALEDIVEVY
ncbi:MAG: flagellar hook capping FlgD N-terminal domain-containing protein [Campylobacterota bacterium]|nr:flagellar hook capping FlgD N-terminal domain-containing protein [Campylobacterota bacterium]